MQSPYALHATLVIAHYGLAVSATAGMNAPQKMLWFYNQVHESGDMDYKNNPDYAGSQASQDFGNFNYGVYEFE